MAIFAKNVVRYKTIDAGEEHKSITVEIWTGDEELTYIHYHIPCAEMNQDTINTAGGRLWERVDLCGNFKALHGRRCMNADGLSTES